MTCVNCGRRICEDETLCCRTAVGTIVTSGHVELRRLLGSSREAVALFHLDCWTPETQP